MNDAPWYRLSLDDVQLMATLVTELDALKNLAPNPADAKSAAVLVDRGHTTLQRILGNDVARVYGTEDKETTE